MSTEFNYHRAQREWAAPLFDRRSAAVQLAWAMTIKHKDKLQQNSALGVDFPADEPELLEAFEGVPVEELHRAAVIIYHYGHWSHVVAAVVIHEGKSKRFETTGDAFSPGSEAKKYAKKLMTGTLKANLGQALGAVDEPVIEYERLGPNNRDTGGAYWKFQKLVKSKWPYSEDQVKAKMDWPADGFMDHKEGTPFDDDELTGMCGDWLRKNDPFEAVKVFTSWDPHPFMVGNRHVAYASDNCGGMLGAEACQAFPCAMRDCHRDYDAHIATKVLLVKLKRDVENAEAGTVLSRVKPKLAEYKIEGFGFDNMYDKQRHGIPRPDGMFEIHPPKDELKEQSA